MSAVQDTEEWRSVVGYEGFYEVSNLGRVRSLPRRVPSRNQWRKFKRTIRGGILKPITKNAANSAHVVVHLHKDNRKVPASIHRLVLEAFIGPCPEGMECCHYPDHDPRNNRLDNLRWATHAENEKDKDAHDRRHRGQAVKTAKLLDEQVREMRWLHAHCGIGTNELAARYGISRGTVQRIVARKTWTHLV